MNKNTKIAGAAAGIFAVGLGLGLGFGLSGDSSPTATGELQSHGYSVSADLKSSQFSQLGINASDGQYFNEVALGFKGNSEAVAVDLSPDGVSKVNSTGELGDGSTLTEQGVQVSRYGNVLLVTGNLSGDAGSISSFLG